MIQQFTNKTFEFGQNWQQFLSVLDDDRIQAAEASLREMLQLDNLDGKSFIDVGSGSGLFSLAARRLGAKVHSFDYDPESVACTAVLKQRYFPEDSNWHIEQGSALDEQYIDSLGQFDIVYSWGVLHHTGAMWDALSLVQKLVEDDGLLFIAIYNDQGWLSKFWLRIKSAYVANTLSKNLITLAFLPYFVGGYFAKNLLQGRLVNPFNFQRAGAGRRGMSRYYDMIDWLGGYPFEVASPEQIVEFYVQDGFETQRVASVGRKSGCNQFVFKKV
jgi:2-polyprenyl-6-hydroxyphenyl methylase/3-demethylubiquinone-9 3-methyltransferase